MEGHQPEPRPLTDGPSPASTPAANVRSTIDAAPARAAPDHESAAGQRFDWPGGRLALIVSGIGLFAAALGGIWLSLAERLALGASGVAGAGPGLAASTLLAVGLLLMLGGLGYYVLAPAFMGPQMAWYDVGSHRLVIATTILIVLLANVAPMAYAAFAGVRGLCSVPGFMTAALSVGLALLGITYLRFIRPGVLTPADLGLDRSRLVYHVGIGLLVGVGVLVVSGLIQSILRFVGVQQTQLLDLQCVRDFPLSGFLGVVFAGGILGPIAEELYFRGFVFRSYRRSRGPLVAYGVTSLLFAALHLNLPALLPILVLSLILCYAYDRTGSIVPGVVGHALNNSAAFCILYFTSAPLGTS
jgi:membrane protease YdiL (CAAX protease family)